MEKFREYLKEVNDLNASVIKNKQYATLIEMLMKNARGINRELRNEGKDLSSLGKKTLSSLTNIVKSLEQLDQSIKKDKNNSILFSDVDDLNKK